MNTEKHNHMLARQLLLPWGTLTPIWVFLFFFVLELETHTEQTD